MLYIIGDYLKNNSLGVINKINSQINVFEKFFKCKLYVMPFYTKKNCLYKIMYRFPFVNVHKKWDMDELKFHDYLYIRRMGAWDGPAIRFFRYLKKINPRIKVVYELPTYPYDGELKIKICSWPVLIKDRWNRRFLSGIIDRIATLTDDKEIFGIPTLKIGNGIDVEKIRPRKVRETEDVHAIAVANFEWWHGYDRFIEGLKAYYATNPSRKIYFHMVGHGSEFERYQKMVAEYGLEDYVIMYDQQTGDALDDIYDKCNLGIASLGFHRTGLTEGAPIKTREYLAKGLPFIFGAKVSDISEVDKDNIYMQVPADDSPIDINSVIRFYDKIYEEGAEQVNTRLRQFAQDYFSMEAAMKEVIEYFKEGK